MPNNRPAPTNNILAISFCPLCQGRVSQSALLDIERPLDRWQVICHDGAWAHIVGTDGVERIVYMTKAALPASAADIDAVIDYASRHRVVSKDRVK